MTLRRSGVLAIVLVACGGSRGAIVGDEGGDPGWSALAQDAPTPVALPGHRGRALLAELTREAAATDAATSFYAHHTVVDERRGTRQLDCSGFVDYALRRVAPEAYAEIPREDRLRPLARHWYAWLAGRDAAPTADPSRPYWQRIERVADLAPGDVIAWLRAADARSHDTGHVLIVRGAVAQGRPGEWLVPVFDSAMSPHADDTRSDGHTGIGAGTIGLRVDAQGHAVAYYWRGGVSRRAFDTAIAYGRFE